MSGGWIYLARFFVKMLLVYKLYRANAINVADWIYLPSSLYSQLLQLFTEWISSKLKRDEKALMFRVRGAWIPYSFNPNPEKPFDNPESLELSFNFLSQSSDDPIKTTKIRHKGASLWRWNRARCYFMFYTNCVGWKTAVVRVNIYKKNELQK